MNKLIITLGLFFFGVIHINGQDKQIQGIVIAEDFDILPGVHICNSEEILIGKADFNGEFKISVPQNTTELYFYYVGMENLKIKFDVNCTYLELIMMHSVHYDFISLRKADRFRKKRFKELKQVRKKAFEQGLFKTDSINYVQEFFYYKEQ